MADTKHTPGPWIVTDEQIGCSVIRGADAPIEHNGVNFNFRAYVATTWGGFNNADARLIAAAPELLEALQMISNGPHDAEAIADMLPAIRAAIAKATGADHA